MMQIIKKLFAHNWWAIFYFNFRKLPFFQAIHLPFDFYYRVRFEDLTGTVTLRPQKLRRGMVKVGGRGSEMFSRSETIFSIKGDVCFGTDVEIGCGALLRVEHGAKLTFGDRVRIGAQSKIFSAERIAFGSEIDFSWECQIFDTNFHDMRSVCSGGLIKRTAPVLIGDRNWFGNRVSVMKGTITPPDFTVAANSICNRDYTSLPANSVAAGIPAKVVRSGFRRVWE